MNKQELFLGRTHELHLLQGLKRKNAASLVVVYGRRRIGKSRLIREFARQTEKVYINLQGLPPSKGVSAADQRDYFATRMAQQFSMPKPPSDDWANLFWFLGDRLRSGKYVVMLDELSWMAMDDNQFLGKLKTAWDDLFAQNSDIVMVLCSSVSIWMEKNILADKGFMGRRSLHIRLEELPLFQCKKFWRQQQEAISAYEMFKYLAVSGGVPRYLEELNLSLSAEENIKQLCFDKRGILFTEFDDIFTDLFTADTDLYRKIVMTLSSGSKEYNKICDNLQITANSKMSGYLAELETAGFIRREYTWDLQSGTRGRLSQFRLSDNYLRFYIKYILPRKEQILNDEYIQASLGQIITWQSGIGLQFENLVLNNRQEIKKLLGIKPGDTLVDGPYFQRKTTKQQGCQIDYMLQTVFNNLYICEIKFSKNKIPLSVIDECKQKIGALKIPKNMSYRPILIHVNGVQDAVIESGYFAQIIDFGQLLNTDTGL